MPEGLLQALARIIAAIVLEIGDETEQILGSYDASFIFLHVTKLPDAGPVLQTVFKMTAFLISTPVKPCHKYELQDQPADWKWAVLSSRLKPRESNTIAANKFSSHAMSQMFVAKADHVSWVMSMQPTR